MSEGATAASPTAGRLLRDAREKQGLHIAALAAAIKVSQRKLEMLEGDRFDELPDATFTRALAQTVCRALKTDPLPVMRLLPPPAGHRLEQVGEGLNTPFRERPGASVQRDWPQVLSSPLLWVTAAIVAATIAVYFLPASVIGRSVGHAQAPASAATRGAVEAGTPAENETATSVADKASAATLASPPETPRTDLPDSSAPTSSAATTASTPVTGTPPMAVVVPAQDSSATVTISAPAPLAVVASMPAAEGLPPGMLQLRTAGGSWVEVTDARGRPLVSRLLRAGEAVGVDGVPPLKVRIGNASATQLVYRGQPTELQAFTRDNVARLELK